MAGGPQLLNPVLNKKRKISFGCLVVSGWFSAAPDDVAVNRAIRTNNPGALNISKWQRTRPGFVGQTAADSAGNITTIYQTPEYGVAAWYHLLATVYGFGAAGQFDLESLAKRYAGSGASAPQIKAYLDGWSRWSQGALAAATVVHLARDDELLALANAEFAHEAAALSPVHDEQILYGFGMERGL